MKRIFQIVVMSAAAFVTAALPVSCHDGGDEPDGRAKTIRVNTLAVSGPQAKASDTGRDESFVVLFWPDKAHLENVADRWPNPYLKSLSDQPVDFYEHGVYDTRYPYPDETSRLYATGYAPGYVLNPMPGYGYKRLAASTDRGKIGRNDFLGCDVWGDVYKGSQTDPFAQNKNKLYYRHLAAKLVFFADRDRNTMERKQYVRNVCVTSLYMSIDGGQTYTSMYTPSKFEWQELKDADFTEAYNKAITEAKQTTGNESVTSRPKAGYKTVEAVGFAGADSSFELRRHTTDRVPIDGMRIDSCYVCNPMGEAGGVMQSLTGQQIRLKMDISAEMSFDPNFPQSDDTGSTTDDLTFTRTWKNVPLDAIYKVDADGKPTEVPVHEFRAGYVYNVYIHFHRSGVNLVAIEQPWNIGGVHHISISGSDRQNEGL